MAARIVAHEMSVDRERTLDQKRAEAWRHRRLAQERAMWDWVEKQRMAVEHAEDSLKGIYAGVPTTAQMPPIRL